MIAHPAASPKNAARFDGASDGESLTLLDQHHGADITDAVSRLLRETLCPGCRLMRYSRPGSPPPRGPGRPRNQVRRDVESGPLSGCRTSQTQ